MKKLLATGFFGADHIVQPVDRHLRIPALDECVLINKGMPTKNIWV